MKSNSSHKLDSLVLMVNDELMASQLMSSILAQPLINHQLRSLTHLGLNQISFLLPLDCDQLRQQIRSQAILYPCKIQTFNLDAKFSSYQNLLTYKKYFSEKFFWTWASNLEIPFYFNELENWQADLVLVCQTHKATVNFGSLKLDHKFVTQVSSQQIKDYLPLTPNCILSQKFLSFCGETLMTEQLWFEALNQFALTEVVKACQFCSTQDFLAYQKPAYLFEISKIIFNNSHKYIDQSSKISPTARLSGDIIIGRDVVIGEYTCLEGPCFLDAGVTLGNFCNLKSNVFLSNSCHISSYNELENIYLGPKENLATSFRSHHDLFK